VTRELVPSATIVTGAVMVSPPWTTPRTRVPSQFNRSTGTEVTTVAPASSAFRASQASVRARRTEWATNGSRRHPPSS
jgi:hypothetical protein